jgi:hypothetical protein
MVINAQYSLAMQISLERIFKASTNLQAPGDGEYEVRVGLYWMKTSLLHNHVFQNSWLNPYSNFKIELKSLYKHMFFSIKTEISKDTK